MTLEQGNQQLAIDQATVTEQIEVDAIEVHLRR